MTTTDHTTTASTVPTTPADVLEQIARRWPSPVVAASQVRTLTGGVISGKTLANLKSKGESVPDSLLIGGRRAYVVASLIEWLRRRSRTQTGGGRHA
ncbi:MAG: hypothetical protein PHV45_04580 [Desulfuromonas thiophila]|nr:hypothetical protein [Desulfuromonas thiophila]